MKKLKEIFKISAYFTFVAIIISMIWLVVEMFVVTNPNIRLSDYSEFLLFLLGYGDISVVNNIGKIIISIIGIIIISYISALFTINLLDWRNKIRISHEMIIWQNNQTNYASILISNSIHEVYNLKLSLCLYFDGHSILMEKTYPYIPKKVNTIVDFNITIGNALYEFFYKTIKEERNDLYLTLLASYIDENNGQEYIQCNNYRWNNCENNIVECRNFIDIKQNNLREFAKIAAKAKIEEDYFFEKYIKDEAFSIPMHGVTGINAEFIDIEYKKAPGTGREILDATVDLSLAPLDDDAKNYTMALIREPLGANWEEYYLKNFILRFDIYVSKDLVVKLELKDEKSNHVLNEIFHSKYNGPQK